MNKELKDRAWACLPREFKEKVKKKYARCVEIDEDDNPNLPAYAVKSAISRRALLEKLFGEHNLTSDAEGEEMLCVKASKVREMYALNEKILYLDSTHKGAILLKKKLTDLFGSKCLYDELNEDNFATKKPQPAEPKDEGTRQEQCVPKNAESGTHSFSHILKDDFRDHNRLHIAAMAMQGLISKTPRFSSYEISNLVRISLDCADALISKCKKGGGNA